MVESSPTVMITTKYVRFRDYDVRKSSKRLVYRLATFRTRSRYAVQEICVYHKRFHNTWKKRSNPFRILLGADVMGDGPDSDRRLKH